MIYSSYLNALKKSKKKNYYFFFNIVNKNLIFDRFIINCKGKCCKNASKINRPV